MRRWTQGSPSTSVTGGAMDGTSSGMAPLSQPPHSSCSDRGGLPPLFRQVVRMLHEEHQDARMPPRTHDLSELGAGWRGTVVLGESAPCDRLEAPGGLPWGSPYCSRHAPMAGRR